MSTTSEPASPAHADPTRSRGRLKGLLLSGGLAAASAATLAVVRARRSRSGRSKRATRRGRRSS